MFCSRQSNIEHSVRVCLLTHPEPFSFPAFAGPDCLLYSKNVKLTGAKLSGRTFTSSKHGFRRKLVLGPDDVLALRHLTSTMMMAFS